MHNAWKELSLSYLSIFIDFENLPKESTLGPNVSPNDKDNSSDDNLDNALPDPSDNNEGRQSSKKLPTWKIIVLPFVVVGVVLESRQEKEETRFPFYKFIEHNFNFHVPCDIVDNIHFSSFSNHKSLQADSSW